MTTHFNENREEVYNLEFIRGEMELKLHEWRIKNPKGDDTEYKEKIKRVERAINYIYSNYELIESLKKENLTIKFLNSKLIAELSIKNQ